MYSKIAVVAALFAVAYAGHEAPPAKAVTYNVPSVAKVSYPGATVTKSVETYSAPSIEKTTLITRTITAPINAPAVKSVSYSAPAAPVAHAHAAYGAPVAHAAYGAPVAHAGYAHAAPAVGYAAYGAPVAYAGYAHAAPAVKAYAAPTLSLATPQFAYAAAPHYAGYAQHGIGGQTVYSAPALGYSLGHEAAAYYAAAPVAAVAAAPVAAVASAPVAEYGAPAAPAKESASSNGGYY
jgi:hypothetical protein